MLFRTSLLIFLIATTAACDNSTRADPVEAVSRIAFVRDGHLMIMDEDGSNVRILTDSIGARFPAFSPDGRQLAVIHDRGIWVVDVASGDARQLSGGPYTDAFPTWSHDGSRIAWASDQADIHDRAGYGFDIWSMAADGTRSLLLTHDLGHDVQPWWLPDGRIVYKSSTHELLIMNSDGSGRTRQDEPAQNVFSFAISPDGTRIAYVVGSDGELYVMDLDGRNKRQVATGDVRAVEKLWWSPDGSRIAFDGVLRGSDGSWDIFTIRPEGTDLQRLTSDPRPERSPTWSVPAALP